MVNRRNAITTVVAALIVAGSAGGLQAEEQTAHATAAWKGRARTYLTGPQQVFLLGVFGGRLAVGDGRRSLDGAELVCPAAFDADYATNRQTGEGRCIATTATGERLFARWTCAGEPDHGCAGRFVLTGGTGAFQGVTGESEFTLQLLASRLDRLEQREAEYDLAGLAEWPAFTYRTP